MIKKDGIKQMTEASVLLENVDFNMLITSSHYINSQNWVLLYTSPIFAFYR